MKYLEIVDDIVQKNLAIADFWKSSQGWAPISAAGLLSRSRLDRQVSLSYTLDRYNVIKKGIRFDGELIMGWVNLRSLCEGTIKWFLSVYHETYIERPIGKNFEPDGVTFNPLIEYYEKNIKSKSDTWVRVLRHIQKRGNAIHAYQDKEIGNAGELRRYVLKYRNFLFDLDGRVPYP